MKYSTSRFPSVLAVASAGLILSLSSACDWREFDDLADKAWVDSSGAPGSLGSNEYGIGIAFGGGGNTSGTTFLVGAKRPDGVANISYNSDGTMETGSVQISAISPAADTLAARPPMAGDPEAPGDDASPDGGAIAIGIGENAGGAGRVILIRPDTVANPATIPVTGGAVEALAFGRVNNPDNPGVVDLLVGHRGQITVVSKYLDSGTRTQETCSTGRDAVLSLAAADIHSGEGESEIIAAIGQADGMGASSRVVVMTGDVVSQAHAIGAGTACLSTSTPVRDALATIDPPNNEPDFGTQLVIGNFDDGDVPDLIVSAPSTKSVYIYFNVDLAGGAPGAPVVVTESNSVRYGEAVAVGDFDGDGKHELVVGDPNVPVNGVANSGMVHIYTFSGQTPSLAASLHDVEPTSDQRFGRNLGVAQFGGAQDILVVGAKDEIFTYFRNPVSMGDVRSGL